MTNVQLRPEGRKTRLDMIEVIWGTALCQCICRGKKGRSQGVAFQSIKSSSTVRRKILEI